MHDAYQVLAIDDEPLNLDLICEMLDSYGYQVTTADGGDSGWEALLAMPQVDVVLLDRMMPGTDGMEFLRRIKAHSTLKYTPVIMQTAAAAPEQTREGILAGVYYYLTKPFDPETLLAIVRAAIRDTESRRSLAEQTKLHKLALGTLVQGEFQVRTLEDATVLSALVGQCFPDPDSAAYGLNELLTNAVEHGNLGLGYANKGRLLRSGGWRAEVDRRLRSEEYGQRVVKLKLETEGANVRVTITDEGEGFDWRPFMELHPSRATDPHGRGIATARLLAFPELQFLGSGNQVICKGPRAALPSAGDLN